MDSSAIYESISCLPVVSSVETPLVQDENSIFGRKLEGPTPEGHHITQSILDYIIKFHTYSQFVDHTKIWEIDEDTYLIRFEEPHLYLTICTLHQAIILTSKQIPSSTILTSNTADQNKKIFRIGQILAKYADVAPCIFQVQVDPAYRGSASTLALQLQGQILRFCIESVPLLPKSTLQRLKSDYAILCDKTTDKYFTDHGICSKVLSINFHMPLMMILIIFLAIIEFRTVSYFYFM